MFTGKQLNRGILQVCFVLLLLFLFVIICSELSYFISSVLGAFTLYLLLRNPQRKLEAKGWSKMLTTSILLFLVILIVFVVGGALAGTMYAKLKDFQPQIIMDNIKYVHDFLLRKTGYDIFSREMSTNLIQSASKILPNLFSVTGNLVANVLMMVFLLFFMLQSSQKMESEIERNLPFSQESISLLKKETLNMVVSSAIGIPIIMLGQGLVAALAYWFLDAGDPVVWGILTGIFGLIPVIGTAGIWMPLAINMLLSDQIWQGIVLIIYGFVVISSIDNLIRMVFLKKYANIHPVIAIFGIILGMSLFGFWGIIFGPLLISGFLLLIRIYKNEFTTDKEI